MNNHFAFLPMETSNDIIGSPQALRERMDRDGYLYLRGVLDPQRVNDVRLQMLERAPPARLGQPARAGWLGLQDHPDA